MGNKLVGELMNAPYERHDESDEFSDENLFKEASKKIAVQVATAGKNCELCVSALTTAMEMSALHPQDTPHHVFTMMQIFKVQKAQQGCVHCRVACPLVDKHCR